MKYWWVYGSIMILIGVVSQSMFWTQPATNNTVVLDGNTIRVTLATTYAQRELGLSGRAGLAPDEGMLFVFQQSGDYAFWMKDMRFSIDMVWLDATGKVIYIAPSVSPDTYPKPFDPHMDALYVLELPAGYTAQHGVSVGDQARI